MKNDTTQLSELLASHDFPEEIINVVVSSARKQKFKKGEILIQDGQPSKLVGLIVKGVIRWYKEIPGGQDSVFHFRKEGDFVSSLQSFIENLPSNGSFQALEDGELYYIDPDAFHKYKQEIPGFLTLAYRILSEIIMEALGERNHLLTLTATDRYLYFVEQHPELIHRISLGNISAYLGMKQSSLSRVRRQLATRK